MVEHSSRKDADAATLVERYLKLSTHQAATSMCSPGRRPSFEGVVAALFNRRLMSPYALMMLGWALAITSRSCLDVYPLKIALPLGLTYSPR